MEETKDDLQEDLMRSLGLHSDVQKSDQDKVNNGEESSSANIDDSSKDCRTTGDSKLELDMEKIASYTPMFFTKEEQDTMKQEHAQSKTNKQKLYYKLDNVFDDDVLFPFNESDMESDDEGIGYSYDSVEYFLSRLSGSSEENTTNKSKKTNMEDSIPVLEIDDSDNENNDVEMINITDDEDDDLVEITFDNHQQKKNLEDHKPQTNNTELNKFRCRHCSLELEGIDLMRHHIKMCLNRKRWLTCKLCGKTCNRLDILRIHIKSHSSVKPFPCPYCNYSAAKAGTLKSHIRTHTGERPFSCPMCSYRSNTSSSLKTHIRVHTGERPYRCPYCPHRCNTSSALKCHIRTHTGEKPYSCDLCPYKAAGPSTIKQHRLGHL